LKGRTTWGTLPHKKRRPWYIKYFIKEITNTYNYFGKVAEEFTYRFQVFAILTLLRQKGAEIGEGKRIIRTGVSLQIIYSKSQRRPRL